MTENSLERKVILFFVVVMILSMGCWQCRPQEQEQLSVPSLSIEKPTRIVGIGRIEPELRFLELSIENSGHISAIRSKAGDKILEGQVIIELTHAVEQARVDQAKARLQSKLSEIDGFEAALAAKKIRTEYVKVTYERAKSLFEKDAQTESYLDNARTEYESHLEDIKRLEADVATALDSVKEFRADLKLAQAELEKRFLVAPVDGQILSLDVTIGSYVFEGNSIGTYAPESPLCARCEIDELFAEYAQQGQRAFIRYPGMTESIAEGTVIFSGPYLRKKSLFADDVGDLEDRRVREILIQLSPDASVLYGSRVECVIQIDQ
jgi:multidrug efflux pump subunit AcrA (membrane-fusion protein)